jgi:hypothetical protein
MQRRRRAGLDAGHRLLGNAHALGDALLRESGLEA